MSKYTATITWKNDSPETFSKNQYTRGHTWSFDGGAVVPASSSPHAVRLPWSVEAAVDPEEALVAAASSCHMLSFLYVAAKSGFNVDSYSDHAVGEMTTSPEGKQWVSTITLDPTIVWTSEKTPTAEELQRLHHDAHEICYIANSIKSEVVIKSTERTTPSAETAATPPS
jgi:organic hydroperoxide reductase OsmC/OhrA